MGDYNLHRIFLYIKIINKALDIIVNEEMA